MMKDTDAGDKQRLKDTLARQTFGEDAMNEAMIFELARMYAARDTAEALQNCGHMSPV